MRFKVRIPLGAYNSLGPVHQSITRSVWKWCFIRVSGLPDKGEYTKLPCLGGVSHHKKKKRKKEKEKKACLGGREGGYCNTATLFH
jgi:hypothetical protein